MVIYMPAELKITMVATVVIGLAIVQTDPSEFNNVDGPTQVYWPLLLLAIGTLIYQIAKRFMARIHVRDATYEIVRMQVDPKYISWLGQPTVKLRLKQTRTGKSRTIETYQTLTEGLQIGQEVGLVKRPAIHNHELDKWYPIPVESFDVKKERKKYMKRIEMDRTP